MEAGTTHNQVSTAHRIAGPRALVGRYRALHQHIVGRYHHTLREYQACCSTLAPCATSVPKV
eukprot:2015880-Rhodomonas_salina.6